MGETVKSLKEFSARELRDASRSLSFVEGAMAEGATREEALRLAQHDYGLDRSFVDVNPDNIAAYEQGMDEALKENAAYDTEHVDSMVEIGELTAQIASEFHNNWRAARKLEDGTYDPREKTTKDAAWVEKHGTDKVDIANTDYVDLPADWQQENKDAAEVVMELIAGNNGQRIDTSDVEQYEQVGQHVHKAWLSRPNNAYALDGPLDIPFKYLSAEEQAKDIAQVQVANRLVRGRKIVPDGYVSRKREELAAA